MKFCRERAIGRADLRKTAAPIKAERGVMIGELVSQGLKKRVPGSKFPAHGDRARSFGRHFEPEPFVKAHCGIACRDRKNDSRLLRIRLNPLRHESCANSATPMLGI